MNPKLLWGWVVVLGILHYDFWYWSDRSLVLGFMPIGLAYHAVFSVVAAATWWLVSKYAWPSHVEAWAGQSDRDEGEGPATGRIVRMPSSLPSTACSSQRTTRATSTAWTRAPVRSTGYTTR